MLHAVLDSGIVDSCATLAEVHWLYYEALIIGWA